MTSNENDSLDIGERLTELRNTLSRDSGVKWTQPKLAKELGVTQNVIARLEKGNGAIDKLVKVLLFYHNQGFNIHWVIVPDNEKVSMYREVKESDKTQATEPDPEVLQTFQKLGQMIFGK